MQFRERDGGSVCVGWERETAHTGFELRWVHCLIFERIYCSVLYPSIRPGAGEAAADIARPWRHCDRHAHAWSLRVSNAILKI